MGIKAVILDRDGVILVHKPYIHDPRDIEFIEPTLAWMRKQQQLGYRLFIATNQGGIAMGYYTEEQFLYFTKVMLAMLEDRGIHIEHVYYCPHKPNGVVPRYAIDCECRKPKPGMLLQAIRDYDIDMSQSYMIGDSQSDIDAGKAAGLHTKWVHEIW